MREIKFRYWDTQIKYMVYDPYIITKDLERIRSRISDLINSHPENDIKWMQYTGLKDVNGVDIYESDIVKLNNSIIGGSDGIAEIIWCDDFTLKNNPGFGLWFKEGGYSDFETFFGCEVIGNIYENPELIKDE